MLVILSPKCTEAQRRRVLDEMRRAGCEPREIVGHQRTVIAGLGDPEKLRDVPLEVYPGVAQVIRVSKPYTMVGREFRADPTVVRVGRGAHRRAGALRPDRRARAPSSPTTRCSRPRRR